MNLRSYLMHLRYAMSSLLFATWALLAMACDTDQDDDSGDDDNAGDDDDAGDDDSADDDTSDDDDTGPTPGDLVVVAGGAATQRIVFFRAATGEAIGPLEVSLPGVAPDLCGYPLGNEQVVCFPRGLAHSAGPDGLDRLTLTFSPSIEPVPGAAEPLPGVLGRILWPDAQQPELEWWVNRLDLSAIDPDLLEWDCGLGQNPCDLIDPEGASQFDCALRNPQDYSIVEETATAIRVVVADTDNHRLVEMEVDRDPPNINNACAVVSGIYSADTVAGWDSYGTPTSVEAYLDGDDLHILTTLRDSEEEGGEPGGDYRGKLLHIVVAAGGDPSTAWVFPPVEAGEPSFLNAPHNVDVIGTVMGSFAVVAHASGGSADWFDPATPSAARGSMSVIAFSDQAAWYHTDIQLPGEQLGYLRDVDFIDETAVLITDSGCPRTAAECTRSAWIGEMTIPSLLELGATQWPDVSGAWSADQGQQNWTEGTPSAVYLAVPAPDVAVGVYESDYVRGGDLGDIFGPMAGE